jgi:hypothetical protein
MFDTSDVATRLPAQNLNRASEGNPLGIGQAVR